MPNVPVYSAPQAAPDALPGVRQQTPYRMMQGAEIGPGQTVKAGQALLKAGEEQLQEVTATQIQQNEAAAKEHDANLMGSVNSIITDYQAQNGKNAVDTYQATVDALKGLPLKLGQLLQNPAQQQMVQAPTQLRLQAALNAATSHMQRQSQVYQTAASKTRIAVAQDSAPTSFNPVTDKPGLLLDSQPGDPAANSLYQQGLRTIKSEAEDLADRQGMTDPDLRAALVRDSLAKAYAGTIGHLMMQPGGTKLAQSYFDQVRDQLPPDLQDKITGALSAGAQQDNIVTVQRALEAMPGDFKRKMKVLGDAFDSKGSIGGVDVNGVIYEHARQALERADAKARQDDDRFTASALGKAQDFLIQNPTASVTDLPRDVYLALQAKGHLAAIDAFANRESNKPTDPAILHNLYSHFGDGSSLDIGKLSDTEWISMKAGMSRHDWLDWDKKRTDLQDGVVAPKNDPGNLHVQTFNTALNNRMLSIGINPSTAGASVPAATKERIGAIQDYAAKYVVAEQQAAGRRFNQEETQRALDKLFATNVDFRTSYLGGLLQGAPTSQRMMSMTASDIPRAAYDGIKRDLVRGGNPTPTDRDILLQYWTLHGKH